MYKGKRVATVKRAFRRIGAELGLMGFSQYSLRHFMADQIKKLFRNVPREHRSLWLGQSCVTARVQRRITSQTIRKCSRMSRWPLIA